MAGLKLGEGGGVLTDRYACTGRGERSLGGSLRCVVLILSKEQKLETHKMAIFWR